MATYYVSTTGNDGNAGTSPAEPWATITRALDSAETTKVQPGDTVLIEAGTYTEDPVIDVAGTGSAPIRVRGMAAGFTEPAFGSRPVVLRGRWTTSLDVSEAYYLFEGIEQQGQSAATGWDLANLRHCCYRFCAATGNSGSSSDGFYTGWNSQLFGCRAASNGRHGFHAINGIIVWDYCQAIANGANGFNAPGNSVIVQNSLAHANGNGGIVAAIPASIVHVENCTLDGNLVGIWAGGRWANIRNNIIANNTTGAIGYATVGSFFTTGNHNLFHNNGTARANNFPVGPGDLSADPLFVDRANDDFRLQAGSPAIGAGWPQGLDIGAYQYQHPAAAAGGFSGLRSGGML